ncbi:unnamed protein product, partial [Hapterophycus canaliculatus]
CCECTCVAAEFACGDVDYDCVEPSVNELYGCETPLPAPPCPAEVQRTWVVQNSSEAHRLSAAMNCSGGWFDVEWRGSIGLDEPILIVGGTVLDIKGGRSTAVIDGQGSTRVFTVLNATLHLSGVNISSGASSIGGAIAAAGSILTFNRTIFSGNRASREGGALWLSSSDVSWSETRFAGNSAKAGGAIFLRNGTSILWTGDAEFASNSAVADGGAVGSVALDSFHNPRSSTLRINGPTIFFNNTCGANGGALALLGGLFVHVTESMEVNFSSNTANVGGAVFLSSTSIGPIFPNVNFVSNSAQAGGAVSAERSGSAKQDSDDEQSPVTFYRCRFIGNHAETMGGAVESAAGHDAFTNSTFIGNSAGTGGALRLAGTASIEKCKFEENGSAEGEGAAVSNIGVISELDDTVFSGNVFNCQPGWFLDYKDGHRFQAVCNGCPSEGCEEGCVGGFNDVPFCSEVMEHSTSPGGNITLEMLTIDKGFWRVSRTSRQVRTCYHEDACQGGLTGTSDYCLTGYEGPYCAICGDGYAPQLSFACSQCSGSTGGLVVALMFAVATGIIALVTISHLMSREVRGKGHGIVGRLRQYIPLQSFKIVIVAWQILIQFASVANVTYPHAYQRFLNGLKVVNLDLGWMLSAGCILNVDFHDRLLISTISPIVVLLSLAGTYTIAARRNRGKAETLQFIWNKHVSVVLFVMFVVYSSVSSVVFQTFACEGLEDRGSFLRADYRIKCDSSKHEAFKLYAGFMTLIYAVGIPGFFAAVLFRDRDVLRKDRELRDDTARVTAISSLWEPYKPSAFFYELVECGRRAMLAGVVVFIYPNTAAQLAITLVMTFIFAILSEALRPYASEWDTWLNRIGHTVVFASVYVALLLKVDVSEEQDDSQKIFEGTLVTAHAFMVLVVVVETAVLVCTLRVEQQHGPAPKFRWG